MLEVVVAHIVEYLDSDQVYDGEVRVPLILKSMSFKPNNQSLSNIPVFRAENFLQLELCGQSCFTCSRASNSIGFGLKPHLALYIVACYDGFNCRVKEGDSFKKRSPKIK